MDRAIDATRYVWVDEDGKEIDPQITLQWMRAYEEIKRKIETLRCKDKLTFDEANETLKFEDSYSRIIAIYHLYPKMDRQNWLRLLGDNWSSCDNISVFRLFFKDVLGSKGPINEMMNEADQAAFDKLPEVLTVYRGCGKRNMIGASWSLDKAVAQKFPFLERYKVKEPLLVTGKVNKANVLALKLDRNEQEIITFSAKRIMVEPLLVSPFATA